MRRPSRLAESRLLRPRRRRGCFGPAAAVSSATMAPRVPFLRGCRSSGGLRDTPGVALQREYTTPAKV
jgi:hypothetical protein